MIPDIAFHALSNLKWKSNSYNYLVQTYKKFIIEFKNFMNIKL